MYPRIAGAHIQASPLPTTLYYDMTGRKMCSWA